jgi:hypothetical protein
MCAHPRADPPPSASPILQSPIGESLEPLAGRFDRPFPPMHDTVNDMGEGLNVPYAKD